MKTLSADFFVQNSMDVPIIQRSMVFMRLLRSAAGRNSEGMTVSPCSSIIRMSMSNMLVPSLRRPAIGSCASLKRFSIIALLMRLTHISSYLRMRVSASVD